MFFFSIQIVFFSMGLFKKDKGFTVFVLFSFFKEFSWKIFKPRSDDLRILLWMYYVNPITILNADRVALIINVHKDFV